VSTSAMRPQAEWAELALAPAESSVAQAELVARGVALVALAESAAASAEPVEQAAPAVPAVESVELVARLVPPRRPMMRSRVLPISMQIENCLAKNLHRRPFRTSPNYLDARTQAISCLAFYLT
jgi:hypothetical protein